MNLSQSIRVVTAYHDRSKHHLNRYARSLGFLDWANQPNPFRLFDGCDRIELDHPELNPAPTYADLFDAETIPVASVDRAAISRLFYHCLALSAWKRSSPSNSWSLRINPSSGALHPTEGYLVSGPIQGLTDRPCICHYTPLQHALERRCELTDDEWQSLSQELPKDGLLFGLSSIYWRESWKYGERAFRYCHHDVGHAIGTVTFAARLLGWDARLLSNLKDRDLNHLLGTHCHSGPEAEHADCLLALWPRCQNAPTEPVRVTISESLSTALSMTERWIGQPNVLSTEHHDWPVIDEVSSTVAQAADLAPVQTSEAWANARREKSSAERSSLEPRASTSAGANLAAEQIIRQRRSAVDMDGTTSLPRVTFFRLLQRLIPQPTSFPFSVSDQVPRVSLILFVHRVDDLEPGLYVLARSASQVTALQTVCRSDFDWQRPPECPVELPLYLLKAADIRDAARTISCHQDIASDGIFAVGMLAEFEASLADHGAAMYPRLFWETGLIGQILYLEAEAAGVRGTGIGCFFDDALHQVLGITDHSWQSLYHFTIGGPVLDVRLQTLPPYEEKSRPQVK